MQNNARTKTVIRTIVNTISIAREEEEEEEDDDDDVSILAVVIFHIIQLFVLPFGLVD